MKIVCVYKTGGDFTDEYVEALHDSLLDYPYEFVCLTDSQTIRNDIKTIPLKFGFSGWWSKMELFCFEHDILDDDILYFDLDTVIVDDISDLLEWCENQTEMVMLSDFYFPENVASGVMFIPKHFRKGIWLFFRMIENWEAFYRGGSESNRCILQVYKIYPKAFC